MRICYNSNVNFDAILFQEWIQKKFAEWRGIRRESLAGFAKFIGVSPQVMSNWWNGTLKERPNPKLYGLLIQKYGHEVYEVLGLQVPTEEDVLSELPPELAEPLKAALEEIRASGLNKGKVTASPEDFEKIKEILSKHGVKFTVTFN